MPYDQETLLGYSTTIFIETACITSLCTILAAENIFFLGVCTYSKTFLSDLYDKFHEIDEEILIREENMDGMKIRRLLVSVMETHIEVFE